MSIEIQNLSLSYNKGTVKALENVSLTIYDGEIFGLIGPDGAGKTSLFRLLTTLLLPNEGTATVFGFDIVKDYRSIRKISGYMPGKFSLYQDLSIQENIEFFATIFGATFESNLHNIKEIYEQLEPFKDRPAGKLSGGMKQKLALCCALIHNPKVLFLDEPTTGVDPVSRVEFWEMLARLKQKGITIVVSTPYMDEASRCDRIALIAHGKILKVNTLEGILSDFDKIVYSLKTEKLYATAKILKTNENINSVNSFGEVLHITMKENQPIEFLKNILVTSQIEGELKQIEPNIEDVFMGF
jgi:ABC-2 type transport system ATP-binding protein